jgi:hypothetical protein
MNLSKAFTFIYQILKTMYLASLKNIYIKDEFQTSLFANIVGWPVSECLF